MRHSIRVILLFAFIAHANYCSATDTFITADNSNFQYMGRIDFSNTLEPSFSFPGVSIKAKFNGTKATAVIKDYGTGGAQTTNYYNVFIDGHFTLKLAVNNSTTNYVIASNLTLTDHIIELVKRTESSVGKSSFLGLIIDNTDLLNLDAKPTYKIEFIGDSWTCGYGNEINTTSPNTGFHSVNEDNGRAWGYTIAKKFNAQYHATAISGRGLYRNNTGSNTGVVPDEFNKIHPDQATPLWNFNNYIPDMVIIHLGTNDLFPETWSPPSMLDSTLFVTQYINFITSIRTEYGSSTKIICAFGNSKSDWWPENLKHLTRWRNYVTAVVNHFNTNSDNEVYKFELTVQSSPYGEDWHPTILSHNQMANQMAPFIETLTGKIASNYEAPLTYTTTNINKSTDVQNNLSLYPNPTSGLFKIEGIDEQTNWELFDNTGYSIKTGKGNTGNLSDLHNGLYILTVKNTHIRILKF